jgi:uncharacterized protein (DUF433 family)
MSDNGNPNPTVVRTSRGLTVSGTRLTIYSLMDYFKAGWPPHLVQQAFNLNDQQMGDVVAYIGQHQAEVEAEYQQVVAYAAAERAKWEQRNRDVLAELDRGPRDPEKARVRAELDAQRKWTRRS